jgi:hypothetical protein
MISLQDIIFKTNRDNKTISGQNKTENCLATNCDCKYFSLSVLNKDEFSVKLKSNTSEILRSPP